MKRNRNSLKFRVFHFLNHLTFNDVKIKLKLVEEIFIDTVSGIAIFLFIFFIHVFFH